MQIENIVAVVILLLVVAIMLVIKIRKNGTGNIVNEFIDLYGDRVIDVLRNSISILSIKAEDFNTKEEYEKEIIRRTIEEIKYNYSDLGIDFKILANLVDDNIFGDSDSLTNIVYELFQKNYKYVFSTLSKEIIEKNSNLYNTDKL